MNKLKGIEFILAKPRGFCAGVERAVEIVNNSIDKFKSPIYVKHEVVHNKYVIQNLKNKGVQFIEDVSNLSEDSILIYSAHGVSKKIKREAESNSLKIFDATCPLVSKVHMEVQKYSKANVDVVLIGHNGHPEIEGTLGQYESTIGQIHLVETIADIDDLEIENDDIAYVTQTTLSIDDTMAIIDKLKDKFPFIKSPLKEDICYATQNRQDAVKLLLKMCDSLIVIGSMNSSNSRRLVELAIKNNTPAYLIDNKDDLDIQKFTNSKVIGITAGASAPEVLVTEVIRFLEENGAVLKDYKQKEIKEDVSFSIPKELRES